VPAVGAAGVLALLAHQIRLALELIFVVEPVAEVARDGLVFRALGDSLEGAQDGVVLAGGALDAVATESALVLRLFVFQPVAFLNALLADLALMVLI